MNRRDFNFALLGTVGSVALEHFHWTQPQRQLSVNGPRIIQHIEKLAEFGKNPQGGVSRVAYSEADRQGREYVIGLLRDAKLETSVDAAGNIIGRRAGSSKLPPLLFGSHIDSVPEGGNY